MEIHQRHEWPLTAEDAIAIQNQLQPEVITEDQLGEVKYVAGVDVGFEEDYAISRAAVAVLSFPDLQLREHTIARRPTTFPYIPGFLSFREVPVVIDALLKVSTTPDLILCDGQGIAHPRRFGLACHLGVVIDMPTIGVAKSLLVGKHDELPRKKVAGNHCGIGGTQLGWFCDRVLASDPFTFPPVIASAYLRQLIMCCAVSPNIGYRRQPAGQINWHQIEASVSQNLK
jgi:deoxyribonuclease V